ncbi:hypothetical protein JCM16358_22040 [Halanaerocella petrolearia]
MLLNFFRERMKVIAAIIAVVFVAGGTLVYLNTGSGPQANQAKASNRPVATVNGQEISYQEFNSQLRMVLQRYRGQISQSQVLPLKDRVLDRLVDNKLLVQKAEEKGMQDKVSKQEVKQEVQKRIDQYVKQAKVSSEKELDMLLKKNGRSLADIKENLKHGMKDMLAIKKLRDEVTSDIQVSNSEVKDEYKQVKASHILIKAGDKRSDQEAKSKAKKVLAKVKQDKDFAKMAKEYSEGPSAKKGGKLGKWIGKSSQLVSAFKEKALSMQVGQISEPVKTQYGYHIIKVTDKKEANGEEFNKQQKKIKQKLLNQKKKESFNKWLQNTKNKSNIVVKDQEIKAYNAFKNENYSQAISGYKAALQNKSQVSYLYNNLAQAYQKQDKTDQAIKTYKQAIKKHPKQVSFYKNLANLYKETDQTKKAVDVYSKALKKNEGNAQLHFELANLYRELDQKDKAKTQYSKFSELSGDNLMAHYRLYTIYQKMGLKEKAKQEMNKVKEIQKKRQKKAKETKQNQEAKKQNQSE